MTSAHDQLPEPTPPPSATSAPAADAAPPRPRSGGFFGRLGRFLLAVSTLVNLVVLAVVLGLLVALLTLLVRKGSGELHERYYGGDRKAQSKVAIIRIEGVLFEGMLDYAVKQIDTAAADERVKAVVLRIVSPGGTITASDYLYKRLNDLRRGDNPRHPGERNPKPIVVSMGSVAASGGYYIAMIKSDPPTLILAEPATITGSIGVYAAFPNVKKLADDYGFKMNVIKAGDIKTSGSPFHDMRQEERQVWEHMVAHAYLRFLDVIGEARRKQRLTRQKLQEDVDIDETVPIRKGPVREQHLHYTRYRADGGIYTAEQARRYGLIDRIGYLEDAVREAARLADLDDDYQAITYDRPHTLLGSLLGIRVPAAPLQLDADRLSSVAAPRLWYLAPQHELAGMLTALGR